MCGLAGRAGMVCLVLSFPSMGRAQTRGPDAVAFYKSLEADTRADFDKHVANFNIEKEKRVRAGKVVVTSAMERDALTGIKMLMYNKAAIIGICVDQVTERDPDKASAAVSKCTNERTLEALKWTKLSEYAATLDVKKMGKCEIKSRDFTNEIRFPPFEFLIDEKSPPLFDFKKFNDCIMGGL